MKIENSTIKSSVVAKSGDGQVRQSRTENTASSTSRPAADNVEITSLSSQLHALENSLTGVSPVDSSRVDAIKQAISEGRFKINPEVVADKLLNSVKDLVLNRKA